MSALNSVNELPKPQPEQDAVTLEEELKNEHKVSEDERLWDRQHYSYKRSEHDEQLLKEQNADHKVSDDKEEEQKEQNVSGEDEVPYEANWFWATSNEATRFERHLQNEEDERYEVSDDKGQLERELKDSVFEHISAYYDEETQPEQDEVYKAFDENKYLHEEQKEADKYDVFDEDELQSESEAHKVASDGKQLEEQSNTHDHTRSNKQTEMNELPTSVGRVKKRSQQTETTQRQVYKWTIIQSHMSREDAQTKDDRKEFEQVCPPCVCP